MEEVRSLTSVSGASPPAARARSPLRRFGVHVGVILYSIAIFLALAFAYSTWINSEASPRIALRQFDHGLLPNFDGYARFGEFRYRFITDSLGFRDAATRQVPLKS